MSLLSSDRALLDGFRRGDREALARVYREYAPGIAAFLTRGFAFSSKGRLLQFRGYHQPSDLDNALQETFVRGFSERARLAYDGLSPYRSYLTTIARNLVLTEHRRREVAMGDLFSPAPEGSGSATELELEAAASEAVTAPKPEPTAEMQLLQRELATLYGSFVDALEETERRYFVARFEQKKTQVEAGKDAGLSHMQARTRERKLRERFLRYMHDSGYLDAYRREAEASQPGASQ
jgi:RNA polymerase sigma-70 factor (ECF subfamily)